MTGENNSNLVLSSTKSTQISLAAVHDGKAGLDQHRASILRRVEQTGDWAKFPHESLDMKDLAYLTAKTGDEFAILRGKKEDILFHGSPRSCEFDGVLTDMLLANKLEIYGHSHPSEQFPVPSSNDRDALKLTGQEKSRLISGMTGIEITFTTDPFEIL